MEKNDQNKNTLRDRLIETQEDPQEQDIPSKKDAKRNHALVIELEKKVKSLIGFNYKLIGHVHKQQTHIEKISSLETIRKKDLQILLKKELDENSKENDNLIRKMTNTCLYRERINEKQVEKISLLCKLLKTPIKTIVDYVKNFGDDAPTWQLDKLFNMFIQK
jgi:hypothetical protein